MFRFLVIAIFRQQRYTVKDVRYSKTGFSTVIGTVHNTRRLVLCNLIILIIIIIIQLLTAIGLPPSGSGYFTCKRNMKLVTTKFKSGGLHEKHVVATWNVGNRLSVCL